MTASLGAEPFRERLTEEKLGLLAEGHAAFQCLWAGIELGLYDLLSVKPGLSPATVSATLNLHPRATRVLVTALVSLGVLLQKNDRLTLSPLAERRLVSGRPDSICEILGWQRHIVYPGLEDFTRALKENRNTGLDHFPGEGHSLYARLRSDPFKEKVFAQAMAGLSRQANRALLDHSDFSGFRNLVDLGGGNATNAIALAQKYPRLTATVMDLESVCALANERIRALGLQSRVKTHPGHLLEDPFPDGADVFLFSHLLSIWNEETDRRLLSKAYQALPRDGAVVIFGMAMDVDEQGPLYTALGNPYFLGVATGEGYLYSVADYQTWLKDVGFASVRVVTGLPLDHVMIVAEKCERPGLRPNNSAD